MHIDEPKEVRKGEELDIGPLQKFLVDQLDLTGDIIISQFPSGFSNLTYLLKTPGQEFILRRPPFGANIKSAHDMSREYRFLTALETSFSKVPKPILYCEDIDVIGAPFYVMERVNGVILRGFMQGDLIPKSYQMEMIANSSIQTLAELHKLDIKESKLSHLGKPEGYVKRQVEGWIYRYNKSQTDKVDYIDQTMLWLNNNLPIENASSLIHNDFKYDNLVLDPNDLSRVVAVLDWEMATIGDPLMDLGTTLGYWIEPGDPEIMKNLNLSPSFWPGNPNRVEVVNRYAELTGFNINNILFYYIYGLFKIAVIVQQIYFRYKKGLTKDERFANLKHAVIACGMMATAAIERGKISS